VSLLLPINSLRKDRAIQITSDHRSDLDSELNAVRERGGFVTETGRVNGILSVTRSLGDVDLHPAISWTPDVFSIKLTGESEFLILACDGFWDVISNEDAVAFIRDEVDAKFAATKLRDFAYSAGSTDNISVVVVRFGAPKHNLPRKCVSQEIGNHRSPRLRLNTIHSVSHDGDSLSY